MKKGDNTYKKQKFKKVKDTILKYFHIGIYFKISDSFRHRNQIFGLSWVEWSLGHEKKKLFFLFFKICIFTLFIGILIFFPYIK